MPNWCDNILKVRGPKADLFRFKVQAKTKDSDLSLDRFLPLPEELKDTQSPPTFVSEKEYKKKFEQYQKDLKKKNSRLVLEKPLTEKMSRDLIKKYKTDNWFDWQVENWGTKWDVDARLVYEGKTTLHYCFDTAWSPPFHWVKSVSKMFPNLTFNLTYDEPGMCFRGKITAKNGKVKDKCYNYS